LGTWKLVACESSHPDLPHPTSGITSFTQDENAIHYANDGVWSDGRNSNAKADVQLDGNWYPVSGSLLADSLSLRRLEGGSSEASFEANMRKNGLDVGSARLTISPDGKTQTALWEIAGPGGTAIKWTTRSERQ
jgi:hypothetical protein